MNFSAQARQRLIYTRGVSAHKPSIPVDFSGLEVAAKSKLSTEAFSYLAGGAGFESTMHANRAVWDKYAIIPRMLRGIESKQLDTKFFNKSFPLPFFLCPIGVLELAHPEADLAVAKACSMTGIPMVVSSQASYPMESIAQVLNGSPWYFQLYVSKSDELVASFVRRAEAAGASGIIITTDTTLLGWRCRDLNQAHLPFIQGKGLAQYTSDPVFQDLVTNWADDDHSKKDINIHSISHLIRMSKHLPGHFMTNIRGHALKTVRTFTQIYSKPDLNWKIIDQIKLLTTLPIIIKGIQHPDDALAAIEHGVDAIYVSNHGGRQVDGAVGSLDALAAIAQVTAKKIPILFDSGVRSGADIMKTVALGADMVGIGRPYAYALALNGAAGVTDLILNMAAELELNMVLAGVSKISDLDREIFGN